MDKMVSDSFNEHGEVVCIYDKDDRLFYSSEDLYENIPVLVGLTEKHDQDIDHSYFETKINNSDYLVAFNSRNEK